VTICHLPRKLCTRSVGGTLADLAKAESSLRVLPAVCGVRQHSCVQVLDAQYKRAWPIQHLIRFDYDLDHRECVTAAWMRNPPHISTKRRAQLAAAWDYCYDFILNSSRVGGALETLTSQALQCGKYNVMRFVHELLRK
jgi:hypothetical protein